MTHDASCSPWCDDRQHRVSRASVQVRARRAPEPVTFSAFLVGAEGLESEAATREITRIDASYIENVGDAGTNGIVSHGPRSGAFLSFHGLANRRPERTHLVPAVRVAACSAVCGGLPPTSTDAVRFAIKLAVDVGEYDRAAALLEVLRLT